VKRKPLWKLAIVTSPEAEEAVTELLQQHTEQPAISYTDVETRKTTVASYLPARPNWRVLREALKSGLANIRACGLRVAPETLSLRSVRREDWAESWKRHFKALEIGSELLIKPSWINRKPRNGQAVVVLDPGLSFGTGQHPTTSFCLRQLTSIRRRSSSQPRSFLDIGTGSGILAIAAARLGYSPIEAFDFDPEAVRVANDNARKNRVSKQVDVQRADLTRLPRRSRQKYDVICANLISTLLIGECERIVNRLKSDGVLIVAGILATEFQFVERAFKRARLKLIASRTEKEWRSGAFTAA
jgi:ribosomal protein L11 methyltransferase